MMYVKIISLIFLTLMFIGCSKKVKIPDCDKESLVVEKAIINDNQNDYDINSKDDSIKNVKKVNKGPSDFSKSLALNFKLKRCNIKYGSWDDRLEKDLILMPKLINLYSNVKGTTKGYILHSTKKKRSKGFILKSHVFIPFNWDSKQITDYLKKLKRRTVKKHYAINKSVKKQVAKKQPYKKQRSVNPVSYQKRVVTTDYEVVEARKQLKILKTGNPYLYR